MEENKMILNFSAGAIAGFTCDVALFPLDTIKTRLQSAQGFNKSGGFKNIYRGLGPAAIGSAPGAALFFTTYEFLKLKLHNSSKNNQLISLPLQHMIAASFGEFMACLIRVPTEVIKQNMQVGNSSICNSKNTTTILETCSKVITTHGYSGFYNGFYATLLREIPFSLIQFPLYEASKKYFKEKLGGHNTIDSTISAMCGSVSGGIAAGLTTPMDVAKTRLMIGSDAYGVPYTSFTETLYRIYSHEGMHVLFSGISPRVTWIGIGGFVFFGAFEQSKAVLSNLM